MSVKVMGAVWDLELPHALAWVLMAYADHADHDGGNCYPSAGLIAYKTGYSLRQVQRITDQLVELAILRVERHGGGRARSTHYRICLDETPRKPAYGTVKGDKMSGFARKDDMRAVEKVTFGAGKDDIAMSPEPLTVITEDGIIKNEMVDVWARVQTSLRLQLPRSSYQSWVWPTRALGTRVTDAGLVLVVGCESAQIADWLTQRLRAMIDAELVRLGYSLPVVFEVSR